MAKTRGIRAAIGRTYVSIEAEAQRFRKMMKLDPASRIEGVKLFEGVGKASHGALGYDVRDLPIHVEGETFYDAERDQLVITLSSETYRGLEQDDSRARFTSGHETGHAILHALELKAMNELHVSAALLRAKLAPHPHYRDTEWQANAFAAALLMPALGLAEMPMRDRFVACMIMEKYGTSYQATEYRVRTFSEQRSELLRASKI